MRRPITAVAVTYEDGSTETWVGRGTVEQFRTPTGAARGTPVLRDSDLSYVNVVLPFERPAPAPAVAE